MRNARGHGSAGAARAAGCLLGAWLISLIGPIAPIECASAAQRTIDGIHVWTDRSVDFFSRETILKSIIKPGMTNEQKAVACYELVRSRIFHFCRPDDNDPMRVLNVYGYALCGTIQHTLVWLAQGTFGPQGGRPAGLTSRMISNPETFKAAAGGWLVDSMYRLDGAKPPSRLGHSWCQLFYDGRYHFLDAHAGFYVYTADGKHIASMEEISGDPTLVTDPVRKSAPFMPCDNGRPEFFYRVAGSHRGRSVEKTVHAMALRVRPGETLVLHFDRLPGRYFKRSRSWKGQWLPKFYEEGPHLRTQGALVKSYRHYGNGEIIFQPDLSKAGFKESLVASENLACQADDGVPGLHPKDPNRPAGATFEFRSPYPMVGGEAEVDFGLPAVGVGRIVLIPPGKRAKPQVLCEVKGDQARQHAVGKADMFAAYYPYSAKVKIEISPGGALARLRLRFITQLNFSALPRPLPGQNKVFFQCAKGAPKNSKLAIEWAWTEASRERKTDRRLVVGKTFSYPLALGKVDTRPAGNPKYMRWLKLSMPDE